MHTYRVLSVLANDALPLGIIVQTTSAVFMRRIFGAKGSATVDAHGLHTVTKSRRRTSSIGELNIFRSRHTATYSTCLLHEL